MSSALSEVERGESNSGGASRPHGSLGLRPKPRPLFSLRGGGQAAGFRPALSGGVGCLSTGTEWATALPEFSPTALRLPVSSGAACVEFLLASGFMRFAFTSTQ